MKSEYLESPLFSNLDIKFADLISRLDGSNDRRIFITAALVSSHTRLGHVCLDLMSYTGKYLIPKMDDNFGNEWLEILKTSPCIGKPGDYAPLIIDDSNRLYLYRYWQYQDNLIKYIRKQTSKLKRVNVKYTKNILPQLFDINISDAIFGQILAAVSTLLKYFVVISGGPGTGKTTAVAKILALFITMHLQENKNKNLKIALAAPTGKATARLKQTIITAKKKMNYDKEILKKIPEESYTLHRLLGRHSDSPSYYYNQNNPLPFDVVIIDEASMIDITLMSALIDSLLPKTSLILLGDKNQLASVEAGSVLGDICNAVKINSFSSQFITIFKEITEIDATSEYLIQDSNSFIEDSIIELKTSFRFHDESGIKILSDMVNIGDVDSTLMLLDNSRYSKISWKSVSNSSKLYNELKKIIICRYKNYLNNTEPEFFIKLFDEFKILCAVKEGLYGVFSINRFIEAILETHGLIDTRDEWYHGRPILITKNDYRLNLFNGDIGITYKTCDAKKGSVVLFSSDDGKLRKISPYILPANETVYAMTVHKSQGSEFKSVLLILPDKDYPVLTRELIYTGITRAKKQVTLWGDHAIFKSAILRRTSRSSGIMEQLANLIA